MFGNWAPLRANRRKVGTHRRVLAGSLLDYKHRDDARRRAAADELTTLARDMELE
jgi:hypothetical protein